MPPPQTRLGPYAHGPIYIWNNQKILSNAEMKSSFLTFRAKILRQREKSVFFWRRAFARNVRKLLFIFRHYSDLSDYFTSISIVPTQYSIFIFTYGRFSTWLESTSETTLFWYPDFKIEWAEIFDPSKNKVILSTLYSAK